MNTCAAYPALFLLPFILKERETKTNQRKNSKMCVSFGLTKLALKVFPYRQLEHTYEGMAVAKSA